MSVTMSQELITPEMAIEWLEKHNTHNRHVSQGIVDKYARDMKNEQWLLTNQGIGFDENGVLIDGQHRLKAIVASGCSIKTLVVRGLPVKINNVYTQDVVDTLKARSVGDILNLSHNVSNANAKVSIANMLITVIKNTNKISMSAAQTLQIIDLYSDEIEFIMQDRVGKFSIGPIMSGLVFAAKVELEKTVEFKNKYFKGTELNEGDPAWLLRKYIIHRSETFLGKIAYGHMHRRVLFDYTTLCVLNHIKNISMKQLKTTEKGTLYFMERQRGCVNRIRSMFNGTGIREQTRDGYIKR